MTPDKYMPRATEGLDEIANAKKHSIYASANDACKTAARLRRHEGSSSGTGPVVLTGVTHPELGECLVVGKIAIIRSQNAGLRFPVNQVQVSYGLAVLDRGRIPEVSRETMTMETEKALDGRALDIFWRDDEMAGENIPTSSTMINEASDSGEPGHDMEGEILLSIDESILAITEAMSDPTLNLIS